MIKGPGVLMELSRRLHSPIRLLGMEMPVLEAHNSEDKAMR